MTIMVVKVVVAVVIPVFLIHKYDDKNDYTVFCFFDNKILQQ